MAAQAQSTVLRGPLLRISSSVFLGLVLLGIWLAYDVKQSYDQLLMDRSQQATQRSHIIAQAFRTEVLASDYVVRDVLGRLREADLLYPNHNAIHAKELSQLLKDKAATVPNFFSMVIFNSECVFVATATGQNIGAQSKPELCAQRKAHRGPDPLVTYVPSSKSASAKSVLVLSRNFLSSTGEFMGGVLGVIELDRAQHRFDALEISQGDSATLLDDRQVMLARVPVLPEWIEKPVSIGSHLASYKLNGAMSTGIPTLDVDSQERIISLHKLEGLPLVVAYGIGATEALKDWSRRAVQLALGYVFICLLAAVATRSYWVIYRQHDELVASRAALQEQSTHDPLTGIFNRRFLDAALPRELSCARRDGAPLAIIMIDLDHFKRVNDSYSHAAGDKVLIALTKLLGSGARESDLLCRYGGEEFVAIMPNMTSGQALERANAWRTQLEQTQVHYGDSTIQITLSAGIAVFPEHGDSPADLLKRADEMLYTSKRNGRNQVSVFARA